MNTPIYTPASAPDRIALAKCLRASEGFSTEAALDLLWRILADNPAADRGLAARALVPDLDAEQLAELGELEQLELAAEQARAHRRSFAAAGEIEIAEGSR